jgi:SAM-dependent methyltransferase
MRYINGIAAAAFTAAAATVPVGRALRVLEIGAGTGGTSSALVPVLPPGRARYVFSDVSELFLDRARERFAAYPFVEYRLFDMEKDPQAQGFMPGSFDAIVAANSVHTSADLRLALRRLRELLAPGGMLVLVEATTYLDWFDMTTGLLEGWQYGADGLRTDVPLLPPRTWSEALLAAGFAAAVAQPEEDSPAAHLGQHVIIARVPGDTSLSVAELRVPTLQPATAESVPANDATAFRQSVLDALPDERMDLLRDFVRERVVRVLKLDATRAPGRNERLMDLGLDSLMAVQLRNQLAKGLALDRPIAATVMFDYPTIEELARHLLERVAPQEQAAPKATPTGTTTSVTPLLGAEAVAAMSEEEIEALLLERLGRA